MKLKPYDFQTVSIDWKRHYPVPLVDNPPEIKSDKLSLSEVKPSDRSFRVSFLLFYMFFFTMKEAKVTIRNVRKYPAFL